MNDDGIPGGYGSLGGLGTDHHDQVKTSVVDAGINNQLSCDRCGRRLIVEVPWSELIFMSMRKLPPNGSWKHEPHSGCFLPNSRCPHCHDDIRLGITPSECGKHLQAGVHANKITEQQVQQYAAQIAGVPARR